MDVPVARVDDYTMGLIEADIVRFFPVVFEDAVAVEPATVEPEPVAEVEPEPEPEPEPAKPARRGRPRKTAVEGSE